MGKLIVYRHDYRDFKDGDRMPPAGDHYGGLTHDQKIAEGAIRAGRPDGTQIRAGSLYVYSDLEMAKADWKSKEGRHLYKLEIDEAAVRHRGDLQVFDEVLKAIRNNELPDPLVTKYWMPVEAGRYVELLVSHAEVVELLMHATDFESPIQRANAKLRDDPENWEFYQWMFPQSKKDKDNSEKT